MFNSSNLAIQNSVHNVTVFTPTYPTLIFALEGICIIIFLLFIIIVVYENRKGFSEYFSKEFEIEENED